MDQVVAWLVVSAESSGESGGGQGKRSEKKTTILQYVVGLSVHLVLIASRPEIIVGLCPRPEYMYVFISISMLA